MFARSLTGRTSFGTPNSVSCPATADWFRRWLGLYNYDVSVRYYPIARFIRQWDPTRCWSVLDVGSGATGIAPYLPGWKVVGVDRNYPYSSLNRHPLVIGCATSLPLADRSWDVVTCVDVLEHIDIRSRALVLTELLRVSRRWILIAFPSGAAAREADLRMERNYRAAGLAPPVWLSEHLSHPFPDALSVERALRSAGNQRIVEHSTIYNESLALQRIHRYLAISAPVGYKLFTVICSLLVPGLARPRTLKGSYRCLMVIGLSRGEDDRARATVSGRSGRGS
jgi:SAM-dependent methyltransferase